MGRKVFFKDLGWWKGWMGEEVNFLLLNNWEVVLNKFKVLFVLICFIFLIFGFNDVVIDLVFSVRG